MPLVAHFNSPAFKSLRQSGQEVLTLERAASQDMRQLHIGLLNMMPDAALQVTEQQFMRLVGYCSQMAQFFVYPFSVPGLPRSRETQAYIEQNYFDFNELKQAGLDALIITGANVANPTLEQSPFWEPLEEVMAWATKNVTSILCSCLATHAFVKFFHQIERQRLPRKCWGVYSHRITHLFGARAHPLLRDINTRFDAPHSRYNEVTREQLQRAGLTILVESEEAGVHLAVSPDLFRVIYFQGHPEYDINSLLKEYKREVMRYLNGVREDQPPHPKNYFPPPAAAIAGQYMKDALAAKKQGHTRPPFPEAELLPYLDNTWGDTGKAIFNNWLRLLCEGTLGHPHPRATGVPKSF